ncbi:MAG TPA: GntR family transcriptional regulator [Pseudonocardiaceae bacterium]|nr:GntR family transcriptional regulator [Pseudonocardiaceae bacterium]
MSTETAGASIPGAERAYDFAKELILSGELPGGSLISEGTIADRLGLSRTPVREAFLRLQAEDLLELFPKRGAVVVPIRPGEAEDVLDLREALECAAVRRILVTDQPLDDLADRLGALVAEQADAAERGDLDRFVLADQKFHLGIVVASGNVLAERFYGSLADRQRLMNLRALRPQTNRLATLATEHAALIGLITARDAPGFATALRAHLDATHRTMTQR